MLFVTLGCYELVTYEILQAPPGGNIADAMTIYGLVTAVLAISSRLGVWWQSRQGVTLWWGFPLRDLKNVAHIHWAVASTWKVAAATMPAVPMPQLTLLHLFISVLLGGDAAAISVSINKSAVVCDSARFIDFSSGAMGYSLASFTAASSLWTAAR